MSADYLCVTISVDALEWTKHWLGKRRCDLLTVFIAEKAELRPQVRIVAVESKGRTDTDEILVRADVEPFAEAIEQVAATLDALDDVLCPESGASIFADIKLSALVEHVTSESLARLIPISAGESRKFHVLKVLTNLSRRQLTCGEDLQLHGLAVVTQRNATLETEETTITHDGTHQTWSIRLVRCGVPLIRDLMESGIAPTRAPDVVERNSPLFNEDTAIGSEESDLGNTREISNPSSGHQVLDERSYSRLAQLAAACRLRGFQIGEVNPNLAISGPTLISISVDLAAGESIRPIQAASGDIARELGVSAISVDNDPSRPYHIRFLLPRAERQFPEIPANTPIREDLGLEQYFGLWMGAEIDGTPHRSFVSEWPHLLVAGTTGSGKTTFLKSLLQQLDGIPIGEVKLIVVDGKGEYDYVDFVQRDHFASEFPDVLLGHEHAAEVLEWLVEKEVTQRRQVLRSYFSANKNAPRAPRQAYVEARARGDSFPISPIVVVIDEFAEIMLAAGQSARTFEDLVQRVVQAGRSALVHLLLATQRPDANVLPGAIKANMPSRVALSLPSHHDSMTVLNSTGAEDLLGRGDLIFQSSTGDRLRLQGFRPGL